MNTQTILNAHAQGVARSFNRIAHQYAQHAILEQEVGARLIDRLEFISASPTQILDLGSGTGMFSEKLQHRYPNATIFNLDSAERMLRATLSQQKDATTTEALKTHNVCADAELLPFQDNQFDFIFSNCVFHWIPDFPNLFTEIHRALKPNGLLLFSTLGPDSLKELRSAFSNIDSYPHVNSFIDMHHLGDALLHAHLEDPVVDMETLIFTYDALPDFLQDLKSSGASYVFEEKRQGLSPKRIFKQLNADYERFKYANGKYPVTVEIIYGHAWGTENKKIKNTSANASGNSDIYRISIGEIR